ncbi:MAG: tRNA lysidine(34) synthetase TilS [Clostridia bacterium]|nr:tRNA lysidine(34) synthetase TilS [Clostridia bacterium]
MLLNKVELAIKEYSMQDIYDGAILGYSCGADSSSLLHFLKDKCKNLLCVHINHMIRGHEADLDEQKAKETCEKYGVKFLSFKIDIPALAREQKIGVEECARNERYRIFNELLEKNSEYKCIVTAHNLDDNTETVIFNLARGTGPQGLTGIKARQGKIMRPLITTAKKEIIEYCLANNIEYVTDSTNSDTKYTRNHIRHDIIPELEKINPDLNRSILRLGSIISEDEKYFEKQVDKIIIDNNIIDKIDISILRELEPSLSSRLLKKISPVRLDYNDIASAISLSKNAQAGAMVNLSNGISFKVEHSYAHFVKTSELTAEQFSLSLDNEINYLGDDIIITLNSSYESTDYDLEYQIKLNSEKIDAPLYVRSKKDGDIIKSGNMTKKIKKLFVDNHIPSHKRTKIPLICMNNEIIAVPSVTIKDGFKGKDFIINIYRRRNK